MALVLLLVEFMGRPHFISVRIYYGLSDRLKAPPCLS